MDIFQKIINVIKNVWNLDSNCKSIILCVIILIVLVMLLTLKKWGYWVTTIVYVIFRITTITSNNVWGGFYVFDFWLINNLFLIFVNKTEKINCKKMLNNEKNIDKEDEIKENRDYYIYGGNGSGKTSYIIKHKNIWNNSFYYDCTFSNKLEKLIVIKSNQFEFFNIMSILNLWFINNYYKYVIIDDLYLAVDGQENSLEQVYNLVSMSKTNKIVINKYSQIEMMRMYNELDNKTTNFIEKITLKYEEKALKDNKINENEIFMKYVFKKYNVNKRYFTNNKINILDLKKLCTHVKNNVYDVNFFEEECYLLVKSIIQKIFDQNIKSWSTLFNENQYEKYKEEGLEKYIKSKYDIELNDIINKIVEDSKMYREILYLYLVLIHLIYETGIIGQDLFGLINLVELKNSEELITNIYKQIFKYEFIIEENTRILNKMNEFKKDKTNKDYQQEILDNIIRKIKY